eukprot:m.400772 g.400772  ORF g.400772 m.400772 type:complete len:192 (-) comp16784_c0_seq30:436-1011(-)
MSTKSVHKKKKPGRRTVVGRLPACVARGAQADQQLSGVGTPLTDPGDSSRSESAPTTVPPPRPIVKRPSQTAKAVIERSELVSQVVAVALNDDIGGRKALTKVQKEKPHVFHVVKRSHVCEKLDLAIQSLGGRDAAKAKRPEGGWTAAEVGPLIFPKRLYSSTFLLTERDCRVRLQPSCLLQRMTRPRPSA